MKCKFCYATYDNIHVIEQLPLIDACLILDKLQAGGLKKITFAGGEPLLYKHLFGVVVYAKRIGLTTSIISNGSLMDVAWLEKFEPYLDWIGLSIDSMNPKTNEAIGRVAKDQALYNHLITEINRRDFKLKINTVVNAYNWNEYLMPLIERAQPARWKIFQTLRVKGQNDAHFDEIKCSQDQFDFFVARHQCPVAVPENNEVMGNGSYLLIDPTGRLFEDSTGEHTYSDPLQDHSLEHCLSQINLNRVTFLKRGGLYNW